MACYSANDLVADAGTRVVEIFTAETRADLIEKMRSIAVRAGWIAEAANASARFYFTGVPEDGHYVEVFTKRYTFRVSVAGSNNVDGNVLIAGFQGSVDNLLRAVNLSSNTPGLHYAVNMMIGPVTGEDLGQEAIGGPIEVVLTHRSSSPTAGNGGGFALSGPFTTTINQVFRQFTHGGYRLLSMQHPWCIGDGQSSRESYSGRVKMHICEMPNESTVRVNVMSEDDILSFDLKDDTGDELRVYPNGSYPGTEYIAVVNSFQFVMWIPDHGGVPFLARTSMWVCVPQLPPFMQGDDSWCNAGVDDMFVGFSFDNWRNGQSCTTGMESTICAIRYKKGEFIHRNATLVLVGTTSGGMKFTTNFNDWNGLHGTHIFDGQFSDPTRWTPMMYPPAIAWRAAPSHQIRRKAYLWDCFVVNHPYPHIEGREPHLRISGRDFILLNCNATGLSHSLALCIGGH